MLSFNARRGKLYSLWRLSKTTKDPSLASEKSVKCINTIDNDDVKVTLYFFDENQEIPYLEGDDIVKIYKKLYETDQIEVKKENKVVTLTRKDNGSYAKLNFNNDSISWSEFNLFYSNGFNFDFLMNSANNNKLIKRLPEADYVRPGYEISVKLKEDFNIEMVYDDKTDKYYLPLQTANDAIFAECRVALIYNGETIFFAVPSNFLKSNEYNNQYYSVQPKKYTEKFAEFNYNELCLALELHYGLKELHGISDFDSLFKTSGLDKKLKSTDPVVANQALYDFINGYIDDLHTSFVSNSPYAGKDAEINGDVQPKSLTAMLIARAKYGAAYEQNAKANGYDASFPAYMEKDDTAYITFNQFVMDEKTNYCDPSVDLSSLDKLIKKDEKGDTVIDTIRLVQYSHKQITRENSPIKNVVLDLSQNIGGAVDSAVYLVSWFLGQCELSYDNPITGAMVTKTYQGDVNFDEKYDENDSISKYNLYCLTSPISFSCGNLVPALLKASDNVILLGKTTGGGACAVEPFVTAGGTIFQISSPLRLSVVKNGSYYHVDSGVDPHIVLPTLNSFYDREKLTTYIKKLSDC